jgi:hypothetical protein
MQGTEGRRGIKNLQIRDRSFERVSDFIYLGNMINENNDNAKCMQERITIGNRACNVNRILFNSKMISRACTFMVYKTLVPCVELLLVSYQMPPQVADRGMLTRYGGYWGNKIPGADQNQQLLPCS